MCKREEEKEAPACWQSFTLLRNTPLSSFSCCCHGERCWKEGVFEMPLGWESRWGILSCDDPNFPRLIAQRSLRKSCKKIGD